MQLGKLLLHLRLLRLRGGNAGLELRFCSLHLCKRLSLFFRHRFRWDLRKLLDRLIDLSELCLHLVDLVLRPCDARRELRAHTAQRAVRRGDGCAVAAAEIVEQLPRRARIRRACARERVRHSLGQRIELLLAAFQFAPACGKLFFAALKLLDAVLVLGEAVFILCPALFVLVQRVFVLFHAVEVLHLAVVELDLCIVQLDARVLQFLLAVVVILPAVVELPARIIQFFLRVAELFVGLGLRVVQFLLRIVELFRRFVDKIVVPQLRPRVAERLELVDDGVDIVVIVAVKRGHLRRAGDAHIGRRVVVERERLARQVQIRLDRAAAECRRAALHREVHRRAHRADNRIRVLRERVGEIVPRRECDRITDGNAHQ